ncbi:MAG: hypothetical protein JOY71_26380 [Acetobacteraceae bacterium]|nr:hypothetical protein [Acetobacteraceae bacterium]
MQREFLEPGGFGSSLGNNLTLLRRTIELTARMLDAARRREMTIHHTREGHRPDLSDLPNPKCDRWQLSPAHR